MEKVGKWEVGAGGGAASARLALPDRVIWPVQQRDQPLGLPACLTASLLVGPVIVISLGIYLIHFGVVCLVEPLPRTVIAHVLLVPWNARFPPFPPFLAAGPLNSLRPQCAQCRRLLFQRQLLPLNRFKSVARSLCSLTHTEQLTFCFHSHSLIVCHPLPLDVLICQMCH